MQKGTDCLAVVAWLTTWFHCLYTALSIICSNGIQAIRVMSTVQNFSTVWVHIFKHDYITLTYQQNIFLTLS